MKRSVTVSLGAFARDALTSVQMDGSETPVSVVRAIRVYLNDRGSAEPGWAYPSLLRRRRRTGEATEIELNIDDALWRSLEAEAARQGVSAQQLLEHAVLYFTAEVDAGRVAQRILEDLAEE